MTRVWLVWSMLVLLTPPAAAQPIPVVAAENFYGDVAGQIGGAHVAVTSVLSNPDQDPHLFEASPSVARALSAARLVVYNGIGYDPWVAPLLAATRNAGRTAIDVAALVGRKPGDNPHIWYDPATMAALAVAVADALGQADPAHAADYAANLTRFRQSLAPVDARIAGLRARLAGTPVTATEPVFGAMLAALGLVVRNQVFQLAVMNNTEPSASDVAAFETDLEDPSRPPAGVQQPGQRPGGLPHAAPGRSRAHPHRGRHRDGAGGHALPGLDAAGAGRGGPRPAPMNAVAFHGVRIALGGRVVLDGIDLAIAPGEFVGLLGPNGAGKTTLMRAVLGLVRPVAGRVEVLGLPARRRQSGDRLHAAGARRQRRAAAEWMGLRGQRGARPSPGTALARPDGAAPRWTTRSPWWAGQRWRSGRWRTPPAASGNACLLARRAGGSTAPAAAGRAAAEPGPGGISFTWWIW